MVLACVDFTSMSEPVLDTAAGLAEAMGGPLWLLHVAAEEPALVGYDVDPVAQDTAEHRADELLGEHEDLRARCAQLSERGLDVRPLLVMGPTVDTILAEARRRDVNWIVVGSHGKGPLASLVLGSTSTGLVRHADRPVVVVPVNGREGS